MFGSSRQSSEFGGRHGGCVAREEVERRKATSEAEHEEHEHGVRVVRVLMLIVLRLQGVGEPTPGALFH